MNIAAKLKIKKIIKELEQVRDQSYQLEEVTLLNAAIAKLKKLGV